MILDVTETIRLPEAGNIVNRSGYDLQKNLRNSGTGRIMIMNLVEVKEFSFAYPECSRKVLDQRI